MSPPISKDWWLAAALTSVTLPAAVAQTAANTAPRAGTITAVAPNSSVTGNGQTMLVGSDVVPGQRLRTDAKGVLHLLFMDQSAVTLGPDSELTIDAFSFDPATRQGQIRLGLAKGIVRVVGGQISKTTATLVTTPHGKVEILGGITVVDAQQHQTRAIYLFGQSMRATDNNGNTQTITRSGFDITLGAGSPTPQRTSTTDFNSALRRLESQLGLQQTAGGTQQPGGAPPGQLLSTGNAPGGGLSPGDTLANDRLKNVVDTTLATNPSQTVRTILGSGQTPNQS